MLNMGSTICKEDAVALLCKPYPKRNVESESTESNFNFVNIRGHHSYLTDT